MKLIDIYTKAISEKLHEGMTPKVAVANLRSVLSRRGHEKLFKKILQKLANENSYSDTKIVITVAKEGDKDLFKNEINVLKKESISTKETQTIIDETIIGGYTFEVNNKRTDRSYKRVLLNLYRNVIS